MKTKIIGLILMSILFLPCQQLTAQKNRKDNTHTRFSLSAGVNLQNMNGTDFWGEKLDNKLVVGFHGGGNAIIPVAPDFYFQPGLLFSVKGAKKEIMETTVIKLSYLEVPLNLLYRPQLGDGHILLGFGPYAAYGIAGKVKTKAGSETSDMTVKFRNTVKFGDPSTYAYYRAFDAGANIFFGYELFNGIYCQIDAQLGLVKVNPVYEQLSNDKTSYKNTGFGLTAGFRF